MGRLQIETTLAVLGDDRRYRTPGDLCSAIGALSMIPWQPLGPTASFLAFQLNRR
ncbi:hypothetical protein [Novipirellula herctigrandis]|uniref:hypothetical protein n=1 Tax=Novipirellula herctigrandis TaxID=2527986 RepID=UPI003AF33F0D